jgi:hypothetical protein
MKPTTTFDCVRMKDEIHALLAKRYRGLSDEEIMRRVRRRLATSDDPIATLWRAAGGEAPANRKRAVRHARRARKPA